MDGFIFLHRSIKEHWIWQDSAKLRCWIDLLISVNHAPAKVNIGLQLYDCQEGQTIKSLSSLAKDWGVSKDAARNFLTLLKSDGMIETENIGKSTRITICNWANYQRVLHDSQTQDKREPNAGIVKSYTDDAVEFTRTNDCETINSDTLLHDGQTHSKRSTNARPTHNNNENKDNNILDVVNNAREDLLNLGDLWREAVLREIYRNTQRVATDEQLNAYIEAYAENLVLQGVGIGEEINHQQRFINWLRIRLQIEQRQKTQQNMTQRQRRPEDPWKRDDRGKVYEQF